MHLIDQQLNLMIRGRFDEAWKISEQLNKEFPDDPRANFNRGWHLLNKGDFVGGHQTLECGRHLGVYGDPKIDTTKPIYKDEDLTNKVVILVLEAGLGDQIINVRFATEIWKRGAKCVVVAHPSLHSVIQRVAGVDRCITRDDVPNTYHDFWIPGFSAGWVLGFDYSTLPNEPYIFSKFESINVWANMFQTDRKYKVGIRWSGNPLFEHQQFRIFPAEKLISLHEDFDNIQFYSLQRDHDVRELPENIVDLQHTLISWEDTCACIHNLDLVITSCTSIAHVSAAMGKPTWVIVPILPYHIWAKEGNTSPWYKETTRLFRQKVFGGWEEPFCEIREELKLFLP
jgi:hypothetical protein